MFIFNVLVELLDEKGVPRLNSIGSKPVNYSGGQPNRPQAFVAYCESGERSLDVVELQLLLFTHVCLSV
jgi:hypothetical protein